MVDQRKSIIDKTFRNQDGKLAVAQLPNPPLILWVVARVLTMFLHGKLQHGMTMVAFGALFTWAWLELFQGVNYFRRALGAVVLLGLVLTLFR